MAMTGFDPTKVHTAIGNVNTAYGDLMTAMYTDVKTFVDNMGSYWACQHAIDFFGAFKEGMDLALKDAYNVFTSVVGAMNSAGRAWGADTKTDYYDKSFDGELKTTDVSSIVENINGIRGIDKTMAETEITSLDTISTAVSDALGKAKSAVDDVGFEGEGQAEALKTSLDTIKTKFSGVVETFNTDARTAISDTISEYTDTAGKIKEAFTAE